MTRADKDKPVVLSTIYTRTGDDGTTALSDLSRTSKTDPRLAAYADAEEANAAIGLALAYGTLAPEIVEVLGRVQNELFDLGADLATPAVDTPEFPPLRVEPSYVAWLEEQCDRFNAELNPLRSFILPGGDPATAQLHVARVTVRRAERSAPGRPCRPTTTSARCPPRTSIACRTCCSSCAGPPTTAPRSCGSREARDNGSARTARQATSR
ncbi:hypothetical protein GCM10020219_066040 [Nonomuraea dietziae]